VCHVGALSRARIRSGCANALITRGKRNLELLNPNRNRCLDRGIGFSEKKNVTFDDRNEVVAKNNSRYSKC
jgi:hypothetical protein